MTKSSKTFSLSRQIPIEDGYDVVVVGAGPSGVAAAISAGRLGMKVLLVEATSVLGGTGTSGLVCAFDPMADGEKNITGGLMREIVETLYATDGLQPGIDPENWRSKHMHWTPFELEAYKRLLDKLVVEAGVEVRFQTTLIDTHVEGRQIDGVVIHNIDGYSYIRSKTFVDGSGNAALASMAGCRCIEPQGNKIMPSTLCFLFAGKADLAIDYDTQQQCLAQAIRDNMFTVPDRHLPGIMRIGRRVYFVNGGHLFGLNPLSNSDISRGLIQGRKLATEYLEFYRKYIPNCEEMELITTANILGIRESRKIVGLATLTQNDYFARRQFPDQIGVFNKYIDVHPYDESPEEFERYEREYSAQTALKPGELVGIPYGILVPQDCDNLWVGGRSISADVAMQGAIRVQPTSVMMGQAAGTAAAISVRTDKTASSLDTEILVETLRDNNAYLPQKTLSKTISTKKESADVSCLSTQAV